MPQHFIYPGGAYVVTLTDTPLSAHPNGAFVVPPRPGLNDQWQGGSGGSWVFVAPSPIVIVEVPKGKFVKALSKLHQNLSGSLAQSGDPRAFGTVRDAVWAQGNFEGLSPRDQWENSSTISRDPAVYPAMRAAVISLKSGDAVAADAFLDVLFNLAATL